MSWRRILGAALATCAMLASCGKGDDEARGATDANGGVPRPQYREVPVTNGGRIAGTLSMSADTGTSDAISDLARELCGVLPRRTRQARAADARAVVWLADVRSGKPLPIERRFTVTTEECDLVPRVQAVLAGGTLNVLNTDPVEHRTRFAGAARGALALITQFDAGQVVPRTDLLSQPGVIEISCDLHPWTRGWIHVFDHPYFAEVRGDGAFVIDSVLPGDYRIVVWHERLGTRELAVSVRSGEETSVTASF